MKISFLIKNGKVMGFRLDPHPGSLVEQGAQIAFSGDVRQYILDKNIQDVVLPDSIGGQSHLTKIFKDVLQQVQIETKE